MRSRFPPESLTEAPGRYHGYHEELEGPPRAINSCPTHAPRRTNRRRASLLRVSPRSAGEPRDSRHARGGPGGDGGALRARLAALRPALLSPARYALRRGKCQPARAPHRLRPQQEPASRRASLIEAPARRRQAALRRRTPRPLQEMARRSRVDARVESQPADGRTLRPRVLLPASVRARSCVLRRRRRWAPRRRQPLRRDPQRAIRGLFLSRPGLRKALTWHRQRGLPLLDETPAARGRTTCTSATAWPGVRRSATRRAIAPTSASSGGPASRRLRSGERREANLGWVHAR